MFEALNKVNWM